MQGHGVDLEMKICPPINILRQCTFFAGVLLAASHVGFSQGPPTPVKASPASCAYIWQGFSQSWGYNHRIHRFADCIETDLETPCKFQMMHAAASGSGSDSARFEQYHVRVEAPGVGFYPLEHTFVLDGKEGQVVEQTEEITLFHPDLSDPSAAFAVVLNGFDLHSALGAAPDKFVAFELSIDSTWSLPASQTLNFILRTRIKFDCSSGECPCIDRGVHYELRVPLLAIVGGDFVSTKEQLFQSQSWTRDSVASKAKGEQLMAVVPGFQVHVPAITRLSLDLSQEYHMQGWESWVRSSTPTQAGLLPLQFSLGFSQWDPGMYDAYKARFKGFPKLPPTWVVKRKSGASSMSMQLLCIQFRAGEATEGKQEGAIGWETRHGRKSEATEIHGEMRVDLPPN